MGKKLIVVGAAGLVCAEEINEVRFNGEILLRTLMYRTSVQPCEDAGEEERRGTWQCALACDAHCPFAHDGA